MTQQAKIVRLPCDPAARRERHLATLWALRDRLELDLRLLDREIAPVQREVSLDQGYSFAVGREKLERALRREREAK